MPRINIEDSLWADDRFLALVEITSNRATAVGAVVLAFRMAQKFWVPDQRPIPSVQFRSLPLASELLSCGLASEDTNGEFVTVRGADEQFAWLIQRSRAGTKSKGKKKNGTQRKLTEANGSTTSYSPSTLTLPSSSDSDSLFKSCEGVQTPRGHGTTIATWDEYRGAYQKRHGDTPVRNQMINGQLAQFVKRLGAQEAPLVAAFYLTHNDQFYVRAMHPVSLMLRDAEKLRTEWATGQRMTGSKAREIENRQHTSDAIHEAARILNERRKT